MKAESCSYEEVIFSNVRYVSTVEGRKLNVLERKCCGEHERYNADSQFSKIRMYQYEVTKVIVIQIVSIGRIY